MISSSAALTALSSNARHIGGSLRRGQLIPTIAPDEQS